MINRVQKKKQWWSSPRRRACQLLLLMLFLLPLPTLSNEISKLTCYSTVFSPYVIQEGENIRGIDVDVVKEIGRRLGIEITFELKPWKRLEKEVERGIAGCVAAYFKTEKRKEYMDFTTIPLHVTSYTLFVDRDNKPDSWSFQDLKGWKIGVNRGFKTTTDFEEAVSKGWIAKHEVKNEAQSLKMVRSNRLDALLTNYHVGLYNIRLTNASRMVPMLPSISATPAYLVFSKKQNLAYLIPLFDDALSDIIEDGTYDKIFSNYL